MELSVFDRCDKFAGIELPGRRPREIAVGRVDLAGRAISFPADSTPAYAFSVVDIAPRV